MLSSVLAPCPSSRPDLEPSSEPVASVSLHAIGTDPRQVGPLVREVLDQHAARIDEVTRMQLQVAMAEVILNAVEHGNLEVTYEEKSEATRTRTLEALLERRGREPRLAARRVWVQAAWTRRHVRVVVRDEGRGFDWRRLPDPTLPENLLREHGRGLTIAAMQVDELRFNDEGNEVTLIKRL